MRTRDEITKANVAVFNTGTQLLETTLTRPGETLLLEVLLDIRDLLEPKK